MTQFFGTFSPCCSPICTLHQFAIFPAANYDPLRGGAPLQPTSAVKKKNQAVEKRAKVNKIGGTSAAPRMTKCKVNSSAGDLLHRRCR
jgi:hypothetical protein